MTYHPSQGRVSKRYNRRVRYAYVTRRLKLRIAELEAELASERTLAEMAWRANADLVAANEKAEAEVERLTALCLRYQVNPYEGGGRESGASDRAGDGASQLPDRTTAHVSAAEPAARKERDG